MKQIRLWHKKAGLLAALFLFILGITGYFLNHDQWSFQYQWTLSNQLLPNSVVKADRKLFQSKTLHPRKPNWLIVGGMRGAYVSQDGGQTYQLTSRLQIYALQWLKLGNHLKLLAATQDGIVQSVDAGLSWQHLALAGEWVNALALSEGQLLASVNKSELVWLDHNGQILQRAHVNLPKTELAEGINLARFVRDMHYGRGLLDDGWSLWINDIATWLMLFSIFSGLWIWWQLRQAKQQKSASKPHPPLIWVKRVMSWHSHTIMLVFAPILILLALTGIVLDHSRTLSKPLKQIQWQQSTLPPIYSTLRSDIWSVDIQAPSSQGQQSSIFRIGNRYGVYESDDLQHWRKVSDGFAYRMKRLGESLYVSGMGSPNRLLKVSNQNDSSDHIKSQSKAQQSWMPLKAPHMFRDAYLNTEN